MILCVTTTIYANELYTHEFTWKFNDENDNRRYPKSGFLYLNKKEILDFAKMETNRDEDWAIMKKEFTSFRNRMENLKINNNDSVCVIFPKNQRLVSRRNGYVLDIYLPILHYWITVKKIKVDFFHGDKPLKVHYLTWELFHEDIRGLWRLSPDNQLLFDGKPLGRISDAMMYADKLAPSKDEMLIVFDWHPNAPDGPGSGWCVPRELDDLFDSLWKRENKNIMGISISVIPAVKLNVDGYFIEYYFVPGFGYYGFDEINIKQIIPKRDRSSNLD